MKKKILNICRTSIIFVVIILVIIFQNNISRATITCGFGLLTVGILDALDKKEYSPLLVSIGASILLAILLYKLKVTDFFESLTFFICVSIISILIITIILNYIKSKRIDKVYSQKVSAEIVESQKYPNSKKKYYQVLYEYSTNNKKYNVECPYFLTQKELTKNNKIELRINPKDELDVYFNPSKRKKNFFYIASGFVILLAAIVLVTIFI